ncbi:hypothetical protein L6452_17872 [Arctium lappa]|uniref:Uncharacterized protein n=1 Tax=Arctium lappa TaxID=4217 RepID=A0ACB9C4S6_ARCLA|nr:hypothetical protein L6452_17872 [Arctium lappa]
MNRFLLDSSLISLISSRKQLMLFYMIYARNLCSKVEESHESFGGDVLLHSKPFPKSYIWITLIRCSCNHTLLLVQKLHLDASKRDAMTVEKVKTFQSTPDISSSRL